MTLIVIGNGFDLALGLPTKYSHFLKFMKLINEFLTKPDNFDLYDRDKISSYGVDSRIIEQIRRDSGNVRDNIFSLTGYFDDAKDNFWLYYFNSKQKILEDQKRDGWIDFEAEITKVVKKLDKLLNESDGDIEDALDEEKLPGYLKNYLSEYELEIVDYIALKEKLEKDLEVLKMFLGLYIRSYIEKLEVKTGPNFLKEEINPGDDVRFISFNYTDSLKRILGNDLADDKICYIHGRIFEDDSINELCNIVLGGVSQNSEFNGLIKLPQRIALDSDKRFLDWLDEISNPVMNNMTESRSDDSENKIESIVDNLNRKQNYVILYGHSLGEADGDILKKLFNLPDTIIKIYCFRGKNETGAEYRDFLNKVKNIERLIGAEELSRRRDEKYIQFIECK